MNEVKGFFGENRFLSNFYKASFVDDNGIEWATTEHYYQAAKFDDEEFVEKLRTHPLKNLKRLARSKQCRSDWDDVKLSVMKRALEYKFTQNQDVKQMLLDTGDAYLEETNTWNDYFWGVCNGLGDNHLGIMLMNLREELKNEQSENNI